MSTRRNALFTIAGTVIGAALTALIFLGVQRCDRQPTTTRPEAAEAPSGESDTAPAVAQSRQFDVPSWEILSPSRNLKGSCSICGQIFDAAQTPLKDATVRLRLMDEPWETANFPEVAKTDPNGHYCFEGITENAVWQLFAWANNYATTSYENVTCGAATDLHLEKGAVLTLRFVDVEGYTVPYVEVHIAGSPLWPMRRALSDERGRITIKGLSEGVYSFSAQKDDLSFSVLDPIALGPEEEVELEAQMTHVPAIHVTVKNESSDAPIPNALVTAVPQNESLLAHTWLTDKSGNATITGASVAGMMLTVFASGYVQKKVASVVPGASIDVFLSSGSTIEGVVETPGGKPIEGAEVRVERDDNGMTEALPGGADRLFVLRKAAAELAGIPKALDVEGSAVCITGPVRIPLPESEIDSPLLKAAQKRTAWQKTDSTGAFALDAVPPGKISFTVSHDYYVQFRNPTVEVLPGQSLSGIPILMKPGATLSLRVVSEANQPVSAADVTVYDLDGQILKTAETESNGYVTLQGLPEAFRIEASAPMYIPGARKMFGPSGKELNATLRLADANEVLRGRVVNKLGTGIAGVFIEAELLDTGLVQVLTGVTDTDGTFALDGAGTGTYMVRARMDGEIRATAANVTARKPANIMIEKESDDLDSGVTSLSPVTPSGPRPMPRIPVPSVEKFGSGDSLGVTAGGGSGIIASTPTSPASTIPRATLPSLSEAGNGPALSEPADGYTTGSSYGAYGDVDDLVVTGPPAGIGIVPITLKQKNKHVVVAGVQPGSMVAAAGLQSGAKVLTIDGKSIAGVAMARRALQGSIGSVVMIEVEQDGEPFSVVVQRERK
ncbi:MAG: carboxypeptidase regulatory-like domain-containing protein [Deltaproteobacteria bacterium]|nr:carboxypeptidase regulatory-like domain-containing protein [Deltaproteobacteria bacterium]